MLAGAGCLPVSDDKIGFEYKVKRFLKGCLLPAERAHVYWGGTFEDDERRSLVRATLPDSLDSVLEELAAEGDDLQALLWFDQKYFLPDNILTKVDRTSMAHAVELRPPFLDHRIVEFADSLPDGLRVDGANQKVVLRNLMRDRLGPAISKRKKTGFDIPTHDWFRGPLRPVLEEAVGIASAEYGDFFDIPKIEACAQAHQARRANLGFHLWGLTTLFLWMKRWRIEAPMSVVREPGAVERIALS